MIAFGALNSEVARSPILSHATKKVNRRHFGSYGRANTEAGLSDLLTDFLKDATESCMNCPAAPAEGSWFAPSMSESLNPNCL